MYLLGLRECEGEAAIYFQIGLRLKMYTLDTILPHVRGVVTLYVCYSALITFVKLKSVHNRKVMIVVH